MRAARGLVGPVREGLWYLTSRGAGLAASSPRPRRSRRGPTGSAAAAPAVGRRPGAVHVRAREVGALASVVRELLVFAAEPLLGPACRSGARPARRRARRTCRPTAYERHARRPPRSSPLNSTASWPARLRLAEADVVDRGAFSLSSRFSLCFAPKPVIRARKPSSSSSHVLPVLLLDDDVILLELAFLEDDIFQNHRGIRFYDGAAVRSRSAPSGVLATAYAESRASVAPREALRPNTSRP